MIPCFANVECSKPKATRSTSQNMKTMTIIRRGHAFHLPHEKREICPQQRWRSNQQNETSRTDDGTPKRLMMVDDLSPTMEDQQWLSYDLLGEPLSWIHLKTPLHPIVRFIQPYVGPQNRKSGFHYPPVINMIDGNRNSEKIQMVFPIYKPPYLLRGYFPACHVTRGSFHGVPLAWTFCHRSRANTSEVPVFPPAQGLATGKNWKRDPLFLHVMEKHLYMWKIFQHNQHISYISLICQSSFDMHMYKHILYNIIYTCDIYICVHTCYHTLWNMYAYLCILL